MSLRGAAQHNKISSFLANLQIERYVENDISYNGKIIPSLATLKRSERIKLEAVPSFIAGLE